MQSAIKRNRNGSSGAKSGDQNTNIENHLKKRSSNLKVKISSDKVMNTGIIQNSSHSEAIQEFATESYCPPLKGVQGNTSPPPSLFKS